MHSRADGSTVTRRPAKTPHLEKSSGRNGTFSSRARSRVRQFTTSQGVAQYDLSMRIAPHLPYLRRFSRAVTGSQASGDAYVAATLEALIADVASFPKRPTTGSRSTSSFPRCSRPLPSGSRSRARTSAWEQRAAANLAILAPRPRQAFLLVAVEGFTHEEAAEILDVSEDEFATAAPSRPATRSRARWRPTSSSSRTSR